MIETMISEMEAAFCKGVFSKETTFRFQLEETVIVITVDGDGYQVERGGAAVANCNCATSGEIFRKIWYEGYRPGIMDFLSGAIVCDNPLLLPQFLRAFGR